LLKYAGSNQANRHVWGVQTLHELFYWQMRPKAETINNESVI